LQEVTTLEDKEVYLMCMEKTLWEKAMEFHGHICPGLTVGFRAAEEALRRIGVSQAKDEELVAIVENEACGVDAVQVLTGCTFGKGNLLFRDWGKQMFTLVRRNDGQRIRLAVKPEMPAYVCTPPPHPLGWLSWLIFRPLKCLISVTPRLLRLSSILPKRSPPTIKTDKSHSPSRL